MAEIFSLVIVGAHNGSKTRDLVARASAIGRVLLIEPVPHLYSQLAALYRNTKNVQILQAAVTKADGGEVSFYAPTLEANTVQDIGDQLGSLNPIHATSHDPRFEGRFTQIKVPSRNFRGIVSDYGMRGIDTLVTDTEGYDARILSEFPFELFRPRQILFEYKHSDGVFHIGRRFAYLLVVLESHGYKIRVVDEENCLATRADK